MCLNWIRIGLRKMMVLASAIMLGSCANVAFEQGVSRLEGKALVFGRILLDREGEQVVISPLSTPIVIRDIASGEEPGLLTQRFTDDGRFYWAMPPGRYQVSIVLHRYSGGVVSYGFQLDKSGGASYFGDLILHGTNRFDTIGGANIRDVRPEFVDRFDDQKTTLLRLNPQLGATEVRPMVVSDMTDPANRVKAYVDALAAVRPCCFDFAQMPFKKLLPGQAMTETINATSPVFDFPQGRSRFVAWELPALHPFGTVALRSVVTPSGMPGTGLLYIFSPAVMLLDEQFNIIADQHGGLFFAVPASMMPPRGASLQARIPATAIRARARYLIVYTSRSILEGDWTTTRPGFVPIVGGVLPTGIPIDVTLEPSISGLVEAEILNP